MQTAVDPKASSEVDYINPVITSTRNVFDMMLGATAKRTGLKLKTENTPEYDVSAVIGMTGLVQGTMVLSFSEAMSFAVLDRMVGAKATEVNNEVCDAIGEVANMIAGGAKSQLAAMELSLGIPNVVTGPGHVVHYPSNVRPICISFDSDMGPFSIEIGFTKPRN